MKKLLFICTILCLSLPWLHISAQELVNGKFENVSELCITSGQADPWVECGQETSPWKVSHGTPQAQSFIHEGVSYKMAYANAAQNYAGGTNNPSEGMFYPFLFKKGNAYIVKFLMNAKSSFRGTSSKVERIRVGLSNQLIARNNNFNVNYSSPNISDFQEIYTEQNASGTKWVTMFFAPNKDYSQLWFTLNDSRGQVFSNEFASFMFGQVEITCNEVKYTGKGGLFGIEVLSGVCSQVIQDICQVMPGNIRYVENLQNPPGVYVPNVIEEGGIWSFKSVGYNKRYNAYKYKFTIVNRNGSVIKEEEAETGVWGFWGDIYWQANVLSGVYYVSLELTNCSGTYTYKGTILVLGSLYRTEGNLSSDAFKIYPNPAQGMLNIELGEEWQNVEEIKIMDMYGAERFSLKQTARLSKSPNKIVSVDVAEYPRGRYIINIITKENLIQRHILLD